MKPASILIALLFLASRSLIAQNTPAYATAGIEGLNPNDTAAQPAVIPTNACPVALRAQHMPDGDLVKTGVAHPKGIGQALHLTLSDPASRQIAEATIHLRGFTPKGRPSQIAPEPKGTATRRQLVHFPPGPNQYADIWVPGLSAVISVEVVSATYADGSRWTPSGTHSCRVTPDLFMPVHP